MPPTKPSNPEPTQSEKKRRTPLEANRARLSERIRKLENERDDAVRQTIQGIRENAETELKERIAKASARVNNRYADRIDVQRKMLAALGDAGGE